MSSNKLKVKKDTSLQKSDELKRISTNSFRRL